MAKGSWCWVALCVAAGCSDGGVVRERDGGTGRDDPSDGSGDGNYDGDGCEKTAVRSTPTTPDMLIVLDRSASMAPTGNDSRTDRWRGSVNAVVEVTAALDDGINFGLMTFPSARGGGGRDVSAQCAPGSVNVDLGLGNGPEIADALRRMGPGGYTPTAATLTEALDVIGSPVTADQTATPPKYVLLVTDGEPNCSADFGGILGSGGSIEDPRAREETVAAIQALTKQGVQTFVVGYQTAQTSFAGQLDRMAAAGGTGEKKHRSVESGSQLTSAFEELAGRAISCSYELEAAVSDTTRVLVTVDDEPRAYGRASDGWTLGPDGRTVTLTGAACDAAQRGAIFSIEVTCDPIVVI